MTKYTEPAQSDLCIKVLWAKQQKVTKAGDGRQLRRKHLPDCAGCDYVAMAKEKLQKEAAEQATTAQEGQKVN